MLEISKKETGEKFPVSTRRDPFDIENRWFTKYTFEAKKFNGIKTTHEQVYAQRVNHYCLMRSYHYEQTHRFYLHPICRY